LQGLSLTSRPARADRPRLPPASGQQPKPRPGCTQRPLCPRPSAGCRVRQAAWWS